MTRARWIYRNLTLLSEESARFHTWFGIVTLIFLLATCSASRSSQTRMVKIPETENRWTDEMDSLARQIESEYKFPHGICHAFAARESYQYDAESFRTEANYVESNSAMALRVKAQARQFAKQHGGIPSYLSELYQLGTSWGLFQMMGINLRRFGCNTLFLHSIDLREQFELFAKMFQDNLKRFKTVRNAVSAWNHGHSLKGYDAYAEGPRGVLTSLAKFNY